MPRRSSTILASEAANPRTRGMDLQTTREILGLLNREDATVAASVAREIPAIARAVDAIVAALRAGGRLIYVGAGSSGRLAALDAAECPPTFGIDARKIRAVMAGGTRAYTQAVEGAEDSAPNGARDLTALRLAKHDVVVGITASGSTPYVLGALRFARARRAKTVALTSNRRSAVADAADIVIAPATEAEAIAGSTRMKAGTAQKLVLNMLSTAAMIRLGHVYDHWMINVALTNQKLRRRAVRILAEAAGAPAPAAEKTLQQAGGNARLALLMLKTGATPRAARRRLSAAGDDLRSALGEKSSRSTRRRHPRKNHG
jgi:N-acetylmuramic acid 6-phosphate etherase